MHLFYILEAHGFACGMLVGAIVTWSEVMGKRNNSRFLPRFFNALQLFLAALLVVTNIVFTIKADNVYDKMVQTSMKLTHDLQAAIGTWQEHTPLEPSVSESIYNTFSKLQELQTDSTNQLKKIWIGWIFTCSLPLAVCCHLLLFLSFGYGLISLILILLPSLKI